MSTEGKKKAISNYIIQIRHHPYIIYFIIKENVSLNLTLMPYFCTFIKMCENRQYFQISSGLFVTLLQNQLITEINYSFQCLL